MKNLKGSFNDEQVKVVNQFVRLLQNEMSLSDDVKISFVDKKDSKMTTGVRLSNSRIQILSQNRLLIDVLRTLAHEWVHEYQHQKLGLKDGQETQDIGGKVENMANAMGGILVKKFVKKHPKLEKVLYKNDES